MLGCVVVGCAVGGVDSGADCVVDCACCVAVVFCGFCERVCEGCAAVL